MTGPHPRPRIFIVLFAWIATASVAGAQGFAPELLSTATTIAAPQYTDIKIDASGNPHVAYTVEGLGGNATLRYARKSGGVWTYASRNVGTTIEFCSIDLDGNGDAHFAVRGGAYPDYMLIYYKYSGGIWTTEVPDMPDVVAGDTLTGNWPDIVLNSNDEPFISYQRINDVAGTDGDLYVINKVGGVWTREKADGGPNRDLGKYSSIALNPAGKPRVAYYDATNGDLRFARRVAVNIWGYAIVDALPNVGTWVDLAVDGSGMAHISYINEITHAVRYARQSGVSWITESVPDADSAATGGTAIAVDSLGNPHIAYFDTLAQQFRHVWKQGGVWTGEYIDNAGDRGWRCALALDSGGDPHASYLENVTEDVYYATYATTIGVPLGEVAGALSLRAYPNPMVNGAPVRVHYSIGRDALPGEISGIDVYDVSGRRVRSLLDRVTTSGVATWDGRTDHGLPAAPGVYFVRVRGNGTARSARIELIR